MARAHTRPESLVEQLDREKSSVSFDAYDITIRQLVDMAEDGEIDIAPDYQRHFIWKVNRESALIESILLGIPVPSLFMATNKSGGWEVVDGVQRLSTLLHFCGSDKLIQMIGKTESLKLAELTKLTAFDGFKFKQLPRSMQTAFTLRPLRVTALNDKSDLEVRYALFERLNTGGVELHPQEIRGAVYRGALNGQLKELAKLPDFRKVVVIGAGERTEPQYEEAVLRFFAFFHNYKKFDHLVDAFLNVFMTENNQKGLRADQIDLFKKTMEYLAEELPRGILRGRGSSTPINLYEAVSVGAALVIAMPKRPKKGILANLLNEALLTNMSQGGTNTRAKVVGRIEFVRDALS